MFLAEREFPNRALVEPALLRDEALRDSGVAVTATCCSRMMMHRGDAGA